MELVVKDEKQIENMLKKIIVELLEEKNEKFVQIVSEAIEDFALGEAIKEGLKSSTVAEEEIFKELRK